MPFLIIGRIGTRYTLRIDGALAQIGERLPGREKAAGAIPAGSTISIRAGTLTSKGPTR